MSPAIIARSHAGHRSALGLKLLLLVPVLLAAISGCGDGGGGPGPDGDDTPGDTLYVDPAFTGEEHGTQANPFDTIGEALAVADHGDRIVLAAGDYENQDEIEVHHAVELVGAGAGLTVFGVGFALAADTSAPAVVVEGLTCETVHTLMDTTLHSRCAYEIRDCDLAAFVDTLGSVDSLHYRTVVNCTVGGDLLLGGRALGADCRVRGCEVGGSLAVGGLSVRGACVVIGCDIAGDAMVSGVAVTDTLSLESCSVGGDAKVASVSQHSEQRIVDCVVAEEAKLLGVATTAVRASGNTVHGDSLVVFGRSVSSCIVTNNHLTSGNMSVESRAITGEISGNTLDDGRISLTAVSSNVPIEGNGVTRSTPGKGISIYSIALNGLVRHNTITIPYAPPTGEPVPSDSLAPAGISVVGVSVHGVRNNTISGGAYGVYLNTVSGSACSMNAIEGAHTGIAVCGVSVHADSNDVRNCAGDGIGLYPYPDTSWGDAWLSAQANTVVGNDGAGVRAAARCDLGGSPDAFAVMRGGLPGEGPPMPDRLTSQGLNVLTDNGGYDLLIDMPAAEVDTVWALWNTWDHADSAGIGASDVYDAEDDPSLTRVIYWPARGRPAHGRRTASTGR